MLLTAGIDLSVGSVMYLAPLIAGFAMRDLGIGVAGGLAVTVVAGAVLGAINAAVIVGLRIVPFIVTLSTLFAFRGFGAFLTSSQQFDFDARHPRLRPVRRRPRPRADRLLPRPRPRRPRRPDSRTTFGRQVYAIGNDPEAARKAGLPVASIQARVYVISGACAGLAGFIIISQIGRLDAGFGEGREFDVIAAAVLGGASLFGGIGSALGAVLGATLIQTVKSGLVFTGVNLYLQPILMAGIIFLAVLIDCLRARRIALRKRRNIRPVEA